MRWPAVLAVAFSAAAHAGEVVRITEPETGLPSWQWSDGRAAFTFNQRLPDQTRAFFQARGFGAEEAERIAQACVFQAIIRNTATTDHVMRLDLAEWRVRPAGGEFRPLIIEPQWQKRWAARDVAQPARIAFRWSLFPTRQSFEPGDWNMGMITVGLEPGATFDLAVAWHEGEQPQERLFPGMVCAPDLAMEEL